jgi:hypothetical protein
MSTSIVYRVLLIDTENFGVSYPDPHWIRIGLASWIRIRNRNAGPDIDPGGVKSAEIEGENESKIQIIHHKKLI